jgi:single-strand DNA-binding protein
MIIAIAAGRIARDAELRTTQSGTSVCSFTVAVDAGYGDKKRTEMFL